MALSFPLINPVAFSIGPVQIHWYACSYIAGIVLATAHAKFLLRRFQNGMDVDLVERFAYGVAILGVIIGGRLGHVLFYDPLYYLHHPSEILMTWKGGMSFHGGLIGVLISAWWFCRKYQKCFFQLMDITAVTVPIALGLGRIANFINAELYGKPTDLPWAIVFPGGGLLSRHPTQLYESLTQGLFLWIILTILWTKSHMRHCHGHISGYFLVIYALTRFFIEFLKDPIAQSSQTTLPLTNGQLLCLPMIVFGLWLIMRKREGIV